MCCPGRNRRLRCRTRCRSSASAHAANEGAREGEPRASPPHSQPRPEPRGPRRAEVTVQQAQYSRSSPRRSRCSSCARLRSRSKCQVVEHTADGGQVRASHPINFTRTAVSRGVAPDQCKCQRDEGIVRAKAHFLWRHNPTSTPRQCRPTGPDDERTGPGRAAYNKSTSVLGGGRLDLYARPGANAGGGWYT